MARQGKKQKALQNLQEYSNNATVHGLNYIFGTASKNFCERIIWFVVLCLTNLFAIYLVSTLYE